MTGMASYAVALKVRDHARAQLEAAEQSLFAAEPEYVKQARFDLERAERVEANCINRFTEELKKATDAELRIYRLHRGTLANKYFTDMASEKLKMAIAKSIEEAERA